MDEFVTVGGDDTLGTAGPVRFVRDDGKVMEGRDGFLFMANDNNRVVDQHAGEVALDAAQLDGWRATL